MGIRLRDQPDAGPTGVAEHHRFGRVGVERLPEERVGQDLRTKLARVVAELADLGRGLVHEADRTVGHADRPGAEQRVGGPFGQNGLHGRRLKIERVVLHQDVQAGRVATAHLQSIDGRQRLLHRGVTRYGGGTRVGTRQLTDRRRVAQSIVVDGPQRVLQTNDSGIDLLDVVAGGLGLVVEPLLELEKLRLESTDEVLEASEQRTVVQQRLDAGHTAQQAIDLPHAFRGLHDTATECGRRRGAPTPDRVVRRARPPWAPSESRVAGRPR